MSTLHADGFCEPTLHVRDLASIEVWERSLARSRQRRRLAEVGRRARRWRKSTSLAVSAALAAAPLIPRGVAAADSGSGPTPAGTTVDPAYGPLTANAQRVVLHRGSQGALVAAAQRRLNEVLPLTHLAVDGIFGPLTRGAVMQFQRSHGLKLTGAIDVRTWAVMFKAPVVVMDGVSDSQGTGSGTGAGQPAVATAAASQHSSQFVSRTTPPVGQPSSARGASGSGAAGDARAATAGSGASSNPNGGASQPVAVVAPSNPTSQPSTYVLSNGVALPLPRGYITNGYVDQGVDYSAPGGTPLYAMGDGVIIGEGISGFGPNAPILQITSGPLKGLEVYYGHAGSNLVHVGQHVTAGQQISIVGYGIVGISTGPHLEIGFYPPGPNGAGSRMLSLINSLMSQHSSGRAWGSRMTTAHVSSSPASSGSASHASSGSTSQTSSAPRAQAATDHPRSAAASPATTPSPGGQSSSSHPSTERATSREVYSAGGSETHRAAMQSATPAQSASASHPSAAESTPQTESTQGTGGGNHAPAGQASPPAQPSPQPSPSPAAQPSPSPAAQPSPASSQTEPATQQPAEPAQPTPASPATPPAQAAPSDGPSPTGQPPAAGTAGGDATAGSPSTGDSQQSSSNGDKKGTAAPDQTASTAGTPDTATTAQTSTQDQ
ncbi:MAG TPA: peptidoglycan-binding protein [Solirubrobacteraceae bacterium]|nr:peptidoglycan-binding protein [Solirubrobacteraceae bacterium]